MTRFRSDTLSEILLIMSKVRRGVWIHVIKNKQRNSRKDWGRAVRSELRWLELEPEDPIAKIRMAGIWISQNTELVRETQRTDETGNQSRRFVLTSLSEEKGCPVIICLRRHFYGISSTGTSAKLEKQTWDFLSEPNVKREGEGVLGEACWTTGGEANPFQKKNSPT